MDIILPNLDGFSLYNKIREKDGKIKILFMSASMDYFSKYEKERYSKLHVDSFMLKPITNQDLVNKVNRILNSE